MITIERQLLAWVESKVEFYKGQDSVWPDLLAVLDAYERSVSDSCDKQRDCEMERLRGENERLRADLARVRPSTEAMMALDGSYENDDRNAENEKKGDPK